jgi:hypothetical protein
MPTDTQTYEYVERIQLAEEIEKKVAWASIRIGELLIHGVAVWRAGNGRLRVLFPSFRLGVGWADTIELPAELRSQVEAEVISVYKEAKAAAKEDQKANAR